MLTLRMRKKKEKFKMFNFNDDNVCQQSLILFAMGIIIGMLIGTDLKRAEFDKFKQEAVDAGHAKWIPTGPNRNNFEWIKIDK